MVKIGNPLSSVYKSSLPLIHTLRAPPLAPLFLLAEAIKLTHNRERRNAIATRKKPNLFRRANGVRTRSRKSIKNSRPPRRWVEARSSYSFVRDHGGGAENHLNTWKRISSTNATTKIQPIISVERFDMI